MKPTRSIAPAFASLRCASSDAAPPSVLPPAMLRRAVAVFAVLLLLCAFNAVAQKAKRPASRDGAEIAWPAQSAVFLLCGDAIASPSHPAGDTVGYRIERNSGGGGWVKLADVSAVATAAEFRSRVDTAALTAFRRMARAKSDEELWNTILAHPSLAASGGAADRTILLALGVLYRDAAVAEGSAYQYRVSTLLRSGRTGTPVTSATVRLGDDWKFAAMAVRSVHGTDSSCTIEWTAPKPTPLPATFNIYRRMTGQEKYALLPERGNIALRGDTLFCILRDRPLKHNQKYDYYVVPESFFGVTAPQSAVASVYAVNPARLTLPQNVRVQRAGNGVHLAWSSAGQDYIVSTRIYRSLSADSGFVKIAEVPATRGAYTDVSATGMTRYYYRLSNVSFENMESQRSATVFGFTASPIPPPAPQKVNAVPLKGGGVEVTWAPVDARDIAGYRVCRAATTRDSLLPISALQTVLRFTDAGADFRPGTQYRYAVLAVSTSNVTGPPSADAWVRPHVATSPPAPRTVHARARENAILLNWSAAREDDETVLGYSIYRSETGAKNAAPVLLGRTHTAEHLSWADSSALPGRNYVYAVASFDAAGGEGTRSRGVEAAIAVELFLPPAELHAVRLEKGVRISWDDPGDGAASTFILYRRERGKVFSKVAALPAATREFTDGKAKAGTVFYYALSRVDAKGVEGPKSPEARAAP